MTRTSALVVLYRRLAGRDIAEPDAIELYLVERSRALKFFGGHFAFPGGCVDAGDRRQAAAEGETPGEARVPDDDSVLRICAARELFEETGVLLAAPAKSTAAMLP